MFAQLYETFSALEAPGFWQKTYLDFYGAWFEADRWKQYFQGLGTTIEVTVVALIIGVILGVVVAVLRTAHDQQRPGRHNPVLGLINVMCKVYVTVIRGTPMMVQLLIMGLVIFSANRNKTLIGALSLGINSGAYVAEIIRGGL
ncbi:MAG TPA: ABC transporter permease subunit, partial [Candidatus Flavonifractor intestinipullorum]|nr:ABC transporter permease subunit [Candidatus Flavonifractor intestinipullorum]